MGLAVSGACFPRAERLQSDLRARIYGIVSVLLLPLFFVLTVMRTRLDLLSSFNTWLWTAVVLAIAIVGKMGVAVLAARCTGQSWRNSVALGALLNTLGQIELVVLNIAYSANVFSATLFTMFVLMALIATMMTAPILDLLGVGFRGARPMMQADSVRSHPAEGSLLPHLNVAATVRR
jgi:Kef-type K+ transport system membrane component KefB